MHRNFVLPGLLLALAALAPGEAVAELLRPTAASSILSDRDGTVTYHFDPPSLSGRFHLETTPLVMVSGPGTGDETAFRPTGNGMRSQILELTLNPDGSLKMADGNSYELFGTVVSGGQTYSGLLLKGVPMAFGARVRDPLVPDRYDAFDMTVKITGGGLAEVFGAEGHVVIGAWGSSTFSGSFAKSFLAKRAATTIQTAPASRPIPVSEPTTLALILASGYGLAVNCRKGRRYRSSLGHHRPRSQQRDDGRERRARRFHPARLSLPSYLNRHGEAAKVQSAMNVAVSLPKASFSI